MAAERCTNASHIFIRKCDSHSCGRPLLSNRTTSVFAMQRTLLLNEKEALLAAEHRPNFILRIMTEVIWQADLMEGQCMRLDETLSFFEEQIGTCER